jgi:hypothetical protein
MATTGPAIVLEDIFLVKDVNPGGQKFEKGMNAAFFIPQGVFMT